MQAAIVPAAGGLACPAPRTSKQDSAPASPVGPAYSRRTHSRPVGGSTVPVMQRLSGSRQPAVSSASGRGPRPVPMLGSSRPPPDGASTKEHRHEDAHQPQDP